MRSSFPVGATRALRHAKRFETNVEEVKTSSQITFRDVRSGRVSGRVDRISRESTNDEGRGRVTRASLSISGSKYRRWKSSHFDSKFPVNAKWSRFILNNQPTRGGLRKRWSHDRISSGWVTVWYEINIRAWGRAEFAKPALPKNEPGNSMNMIWSHQILPSAKWTS